MKYLHKDKELFKVVIDQMLSQSSLEPDVIEKDYYVTMVLKKLAERFDFSVFKGGTSLQKCHRIISRFSEDIDIAIDSHLSQGQKKKIKYGIVDIADELGMMIPNLENTRSRRDYNRYILKYGTSSNWTPDGVQPAVLLETSYAEISFPTVKMPVHSYVGDFLEKESPDLLKSYALEPFDMKVQGLDRTLIDKVFALCDYYMNGRVKRHSRHIYDIYKLLPAVPQDENLRTLIEEVRAVRAKTGICPSAMTGVNVPEMLKTIIEDEVYKEDYNMLTLRLLEDRVPYEEAISSVMAIANSDLFDT